MLKKALKRTSYFTAAAGSGWRDGFLKTLANLTRSQLDEIAPFFELLVNDALPGYSELDSIVRLVPLKKKKGGVRPIGVAEPFSKIEGFLWLESIMKSAKKVLSPFQFGVFMKAGGEACVRAFQYENDIWPAKIGEVDGINFFNTMERPAIVQGAALISPSYERYTARRMSVPTV